MKIAIILISETSLAIAQTLQKELPLSAIFSTSQVVSEQGCRYIDSIQMFVSEAFTNYDAFIFIGAMGICVRSIAPCVKDKHTDPAVICVDSTGRYAISVLSGHIGGANELTKQVADILGAESVITTQSDRTGLWALDTLDKQFSWYTAISKNTDMNKVISLFVNKAPTALLLDVRDKGTDFLERTCPQHVDIYYEINDIPSDNRYQLLIAVTPYRYDHHLPVLYFVPKVMHIGLGCAHNADPAGPLEGIRNILSDARIFPESICTVSSIEEKRNELLLKRMADTYETLFYTAAELKEIEVPHPSDIVLKHRGTPSVCEASALLSSGGGELIISKQKGPDYTVAIAMDIAAKRCGHIEIVGAGPGDPELVSVRGHRMLEEADLILYAGSLVPRELTLCAKEGATVRSSASMTLEEQFALMKEFYDRGKFIVRLHTGDPCIYGAIQEQMNFFDQYRMSYHITPGISSFQAAAAALRSQFTIPEKVQTIILTRGEGRTPMPEKEKLHLLARSQSTMCIFLSAGIVDEVQKELLEHYPPTTPVAACYHLTWKDEHIYRGELKDLAAIVKDNGLTLTTMLVVGDAIDNREGLSRLYSHEFKHIYRK